MSLVGMVVAGTMIADLVAHRMPWDVELGPLQRWSPPVEPDMPGVAVVRGIANAFKNALAASTGQDAA
jgi:hypothetical protein